MTNRAAYTRLLAENERHTESFDRSALTPPPLSGLATLACIDARLDIEEALGLRTGDAHIMGTHESGMRARLAEATGRTLDLSFGAFDDLEATVRWSVERIWGHPWIKPVPIHGLIFDVTTGGLSEIG